MRKTRLLAMTVALFMLTGCSGESSDNVMGDIRSDFQNAENIQFSANILADYGERVFTYGVRFQSAADGGTITITDPASIAGTTVTIQNGGATLGFDGAQVFTGEIMPDGLSPVDAVPMLVDMWREGLITETVRERYGDEDCIAALFRVSDDVNMRTWFSESAALPLHAEVYFDGYTVLQFDFTNVIAE